MVSGGGRILIERFEAGGEDATNASADEALPNRADDTHDAVHAVDSLRGELEHEQQQDDHDAEPEDDHAHPYKTAHSSCSSALSQCISLAEVESRGRAENQRGSAFPERKMAMKNRIGVCVDTGRSCRHTPLRGNTRSTDVTWLAQRAELAHESLAKQQHVVPLLTQRREMTAEHGKVGIEKVEIETVAKPAIGNRLLESRSRAGGCQWPVSRRSLFPPSLFQPCRVPQS